VVSNPTNRVPGIYAIYGRISAIEEAAIYMRLRY
jgi:hypothetical protein